MRLTARAGEPVPASAILFEAVRFALAVAEETGGAFDPTVGDRMEARGFDREHRTGRVVPATIAPDAGVSYRDVQLDSAHQTITLRRPLTLDLGAVAKGLAIDAAARELQPFVRFRDRRRRRSLSRRQEPRRRRRGRSASAIRGRIAS